MSQPDVAPTLNDAAQLLSRATEDRDLRTRLHASYRGRHDVLDALWWRVHPLTASPSGKPDPAAALDALRRAAYSRSADAQAQLALRDAMIALEVDTAELDRVLALDYDHQEYDHQEPVPATTHTPNAPLARRRPLSLAIVAVLVAAAAAFSLGRFAGTPTAVGAAPSSTPSQYGGAQRGAATLALLESAQQPHDIPPFALGNDTIASSVHLIFDSYGPGVVVYGALGQEDTVCMIVIITDQQSSQNCSSADHFIDNGLRLRVTTTGRVVNDAGYLVPSYYEFTWVGDGSVSATSNAVPYPALPRK